MADNSTLPATGDIIASDDVGGVKFQRVKIAIGGDGVAADNDATHPLYNSPIAGEAHIGEVGGNTAVVGGSFTRLANTTAYVSGQLIANSATPGSVAPIACAVARKNAGTGVITGVRLSKSGASLANAAFRVHLFKTSPTTAVGDAGTFAGGVNGVTAIALGYVDVTMDQAYSDGAKGFASSQAKAFDAGAGSQNIFALIEARAAYVPVSAEIFTVALEVLRD